MKPADPSHEKPTSDEPPVFRSYFELLEAKYDGDAKPAAREEPRAAEPKKPRTRRREAAQRSRGARREGRQWLLTLAVLVAVAGLFLALVRLFDGGQAGPETNAETSTEARPAAGPAAGDGPEDSPRSPDAPTEPRPGAQTEAASSKPAPADAAEAGRETEDIPADPDQPTLAALTDDDEIEPASPRVESQANAADDPRGEDRRAGPAAADGEPSAETSPEPAATRATENLSRPSQGQASRSQASQSQANQGQTNRSQANRSPENRIPASQRPGNPSQTSQAPDRSAETSQAASRRTTSRGATTGDGERPVAQADETVSAGGELVLPRKVFAPQPSYPRNARQRGEEGTVVVRGLVTPRGDVRQAEVAEGVSTDLDRAALEAFRTWQFIPARRGERPIESSYRVAFHFTLEDAETGTETAAIPAQAPPADDAAPLPFGGDFVAPERLVTPLPSYPQSAWASGVTGDVQLQIVVEKNGKVSRVDVLQGLPNGISEAAVAAVERWRFRPATRGGEPVRVEHRVTLRFAP